MGSHVSVAQLGHRGLGGPEVNVWVQCQGGTHTATSGPQDRQLNEVGCSPL